MPFGVLPKNGFKRPLGSYARGNRPRARKSKALIKTIKQVAQRVTNAALETKYVQNEINALPFNSGVLSGAEQYSCYPTLAAGTGTYQRLGINITPVRCQNNWVVSLNSVVRSVNVIVDLFIMIDKNHRYYPEVVAGGAPFFLRTGNASGPGSCQTYNGNNTDSFRAINKERYTLLKHFRFQLVSNVGQANGDTTSNNAPNVAGQSQKTLQYIVDTPKQLNYDPGRTVADYPNGHAPFWCLGYSKVDGTPPDLANLSITVSHMTQMLYKDC